MHDVYLALNGYRTPLKAVIAIFECSRTVAQWGMSRGEIDLNRCGSLSAAGRLLSSVVYVCNNREMLG